jgi:hypothetical protein
MHRATPTAFVKPIHSVKNEEHNRFRLPTGSLCCSLLYLDRNPSPSRPPRYLPSRAPILLQCIIPLAPPRCSRALAPPPPPTGPPTIAGAACRTRRPRQHHVQAIASSFSREGSSLLSVCIRKGSEGDLHELMHRQAPDDLFSSERFNREEKTLVICLFQLINFSYLSILFH